MTLVISEPVSAMIDSAMLRVIYIDEAGVAAPNIRVDERIG